MKTACAVSALALLIAATPTNAADLYKGGMKDVSSPEILAPTWSGFYIGANAGGDWASVGDSNGNYPRIMDSGITGGGQLGYNYQTGVFVVGLETDFGVATASAINETGFLVDVTGRLGVASGPALFYIKGGWAYLDTEHFDTFDGWTLGGGIEYLLSPSWSLKGEYQRFDFTGNALYSDENLEVDVVKVGFNYHLNAGYSPLK